MTDEIGTHDFGDAERPDETDPADATQPVEGGRDEVADLPGADTADPVDLPAEKEDASDRR